MNVIPYINKSNCRETLESAIIEHDRATQRLEESRTQLQRMRAVATDVSKIEAEIAAINAQHGAALKTWAEEGADIPMPSAPDAALGQAYRRLAQAKASADGAAIAVEAIVDKQRELVDAVSKAAARKQHAAIGVLADDGYRHAERAQSLLAEARREHALAEGLALAERRIAEKVGDCIYPSMNEAARRVTTALEPVWKAVRAPKPFDGMAAQRAAHAWHAFYVALLTDAEATLEAPGSCESPRPPSEKAI